MSVKAFLNKENQELPDTYFMTIHYIDGKSEEIEVAHHTYFPKFFRHNEKGEIIFDDNGDPMDICDWKFIELATVDDKWSIIPLTNVKRVEFDKNWSKIVAIQSQQDKKPKIKNK